MRIKANRHGQRKPDKKTNHTSSTGIQTTANLDQEDLQHAQQR